MKYNIYELQPASCQFDNEIEVYLGVVEMTTPTNNIGDQINPGSILRKLDRDTVTNIYYRVLSISRTNFNNSDDTTKVVALKLDKRPDERLYGHYEVTDIRD